MGCAFSSSSSRSSLRPFAGVRVIHTNGHVQDFDGPVTVARATAAASPSLSARYVLCSPAHLLQPSRAPFRPDDELSPGTVYFLLPHSFFQSDSSAVDLACLMNHLTSLARKGSAATAAAAASPLDALFMGRQSARTDKPPAVSRERCSAAAVPPPERWKPGLDTVDECA